MSDSNERSTLGRLLQKTLGLDPSFRLSLVHHCVEILRELTHDLALDPPVNAPDERSEDSGPSIPVPEAVPLPAGSPSVLPEYGDEASLDRARTEALDVFASRPVDQHSYVVLWMDQVHVWGHPLLLCLGATSEGYRHFLGFAEAPPRDMVPIHRLFQDLIHRGIGTEPGPFCITSGDAQLSRLVAESLHPNGLQYCQVRKRERVVSYLKDSDRDRIKGALMRAYAFPGYEEAHAALMEIHADLLRCNRSVAHVLKQDLEQTLTVHRTGRLDQLSRSFRSRRCLTRAAQKLNQRVKGIPPTARRAQIAFVLLEMELRMRRLDHASELSTLPTLLSAQASV